MGDEHAGGARSTEVVAEQLSHDRPLGHVEGGHRLVEEEETRLGGQRPGQGHPLGLATGEAADAMVRDVADAQPVEPVLRHGRRLRSRRPASAGSEGHVGQRIEVGEQEMLLEDQPARSLLRGYQHAAGGIVEHAAVEDDPSAGERQHAGEGPQQGRLAGSVRTQHRHHLAVRHVEVDVLVELGEPHLDVGRQAHRRTAPSHRPRRAISTANETTNSSSESATATRSSPSRAR